MSDTSLPRLDDLGEPTSNKVLELCRRFEADCDRSRADFPRIEDYLSQIDTDAEDVLLAELIRVEIRLLQSLGHSYRPEDYQRRFPDRAWLDQLEAEPTHPESERATLSPEAGSYHAETLPPSDDDFSADTRPPESGTARDSPSPPTTSGPASVPGYEILGELGRGGMGVVYKAKHLQLNRVVALKMILAGGHAGRDDLARFETEAESVARLQHPNIVQIHDIGSQDGLPYFSLEFCTGGALADRLDGTPMPEPEAASLTAKLASAMHVAHSKGVIHRDLKPANILLDEVGSPKITDFGLAKKLDEDGRTQSGAVMGTPSYMAPEQAAGKVEELGPACDIYALGAILYEFLTGRPPFKAATPLDTILLVNRQEPVPPRQLNEKLSIDLETICLKCLEKEPHKRYDTAASLADDLRRFQAHEPIRARPVGRWEKAKKWVRRNPTVSALSATVLSVLIVGVVVSSVLAYWARSAEKSAKNEATNARISEANANTARDNLKTKNDELLTILARSLVSSFPEEMTPNMPNPLSIIETRSLEYLATTSDETLRTRFLTEALASPVSTHQLVNRADSVLLAAVGLDPDRRKRFERLMLDKALGLSSSLAHQVDIGVLLVALGDLSPKAVRAITPILVAGLVDTIEFARVQPIADSLEQLADQMTTEDALRAIEVLERSLPKALTLEHGNLRRRCILAMLPRVPRAKRGAIEERLLTSLLDSTAQWKANEWLRAHEILLLLLDRMSEQKRLALSQQALDSVVRLLVTQGGPRSSRAVYDRIGDFARRADPIRVASMFFDDLAPRTKTDPQVGSFLANSFGPVVQRLDSKQTLPFATRAVTLLSSSTASYLRTVMRSCLLLSIDRLHPKEADELGLHIADSMITTPKFISDLNSCLVELAPRMSEPGAEAVLRKLLDAFSKRPSLLLIRELSSSSESLAAQLTIKTRIELARTAIAPSRKTGSYEVASETSKTIAVLVTGVETVEANRVANVAVAAVRRLFDKATRPLEVKILSEGLVALALELPPQQRAPLLDQLADRTADVLDKTDPPNDVPALCAALHNIAIHQPAASASPNFERIYDKLATGLTKVPLGMAAAYLWQLTKLAEVRSDKAAPIRAKSAKRAIETATHPQGGSRFYSLRQKLPQLAALLDDGSVVETTRHLIASATTTTNHQLGKDIIPVLRVLTPRLDSNASAMFLEELVRAVPNTKPVALVLSQVDMCRYLAKRLPEDNARDVFDRLARVLLEKIEDPTSKDHERSLLIWAFRDVVSELPAQRAHELSLPPSRFCLERLAESKVPVSQKGLARSLIFAAAHLEPSKRADVILEGIHRVKSPTLLSLSEMIESLCDAADLLPPEVARTRCSRAVVIFSEALSRKSRVGRTNSVAHSLVRLSGHLDPEEGFRLRVQVAKMLLPEIAWAVTPAIRKTYEVELEALLSGAPPLEFPELAATVGTLGSGSSRLLAVAILGSAHRPAPNRLGVRELTEILSHPSCIGMNRRLVLDQLEHLSRRDFPDLWSFVGATRGSN